MEDGVTVSHGHPYGSSVCLPGLGLDECEHQPMVWGKKKIKAQELQEFVLRPYPFKLRIEFAFKYQL